MFIEVTNKTGDQQLMIAVSAISAFRPGPGNSTIVLVGNDLEYYVKESYTEFRAVVAEAVRGVVVS